MEKVDSGLFLTWALLAIFFLFLSSTLVKKKKSPTCSPKVLPPGPRKLPVIGNLHNLAGLLPWRALNDLAKIYGPILHVQLGEISAFVVSSSRLAKAVMTTHDLALADRPVTFATKTLFYNQKDVAFAPYGEHWRHTRKICTMELLSNKKVGSFSSIRTEMVSDLITSVQTSLGRPFNLTEGVFSLSNNIVRRAVFGHSFKGCDELMPLLKYQMDCLGKFIVSDLFPSMRLLDQFSVIKHKLPKMQQKVDRVMDSIISERKNKRRLGPKDVDEQQGEENLLDVLIRLQENGDQEFQITDTIMKALVFEMFFGGADTVSTIMEWALSEMVNDPRVMEKAQAEVKRVVGENKTTVDEGHCEQLVYLKMVLKETLRLHPPAPLMFPRQCRQVCEIDGYIIPIGAHVLINIWAICRDPSLWDDAERFKPERFENNCTSFAGAHFEFTPFGAGRRMCPGVSFGLAVVETVLANLLYHFDWELPGPQDLNMEETFGAVARRKEPLYLVPAYPSTICPSKKILLDYF